MSSRRFRKNSQRHFDRPAVPFHPLTRVMKHELSYENQTANVRGVYGRGRKLVVDYGYSTVPVHVPLDARTLEIGGQWPLCSFFLSLNNSFGFSLKGQLTVRKTFFDDEKNNVFAPAAPTSSSDQKLSARLRVRNFHFPTPDDNETFLRIIEDYQATGHNDCKLVKPSFDRCLLRTKLRPTYLIPRFYLSLCLSRSSGSNSTCLSTGDSR